MRFKIYFEDLSKEKQDQIWVAVREMFFGNTDPEDRPNPDEMQKLVDDHINLHSRGQLWDIWVPTD